MILRAAEPKEGDPWLSCRQGRRGNAAASLWKGEGLLCLSGAVLCAKGYGSFIYQERFKHNNSPLLRGMPPTFLA